MKHTFEAEDGTMFPTEAECKQYEDNERIIGTLSCLSAVDIRDALARERVDLADAFERAGNIIAKKRRESGELRRGSLKQASEYFIKREAAMKDTMK